MNPVISSYAPTAGLPNDLMRAVDALADGLTLSVAP